MQAVLDRLSRLAEVTAGRVPMELMSRGDEVIARADQRLRLGQETVVALAGATGSGKSSLTNALARAAIATVGVRRPTTSQTLSISFAPENTALLDWLRVPRRYEVKPPQEGLERLVLLDLPDHDSTAKPHRAEVDRRFRWWISSCGCWTRRNMRMSSSTASTCSRWPPTAT